MAYALLGVASAIFFVVLFLHVPIGTEARDYIFYRGYLAQIGSFWGLIIPPGINRRLVSMAVFALSRDACGFGATCLNAIQIVLLLLCGCAGALHLHQLLRRPVLVACCMGLWCVSLPVFAAAFWQATQHDKLAFLFSLTALSCGFSAMRREVQGIWLVVANLVVLAMFVLAFNAKEIAFFLPVAAIAQVMLLGPAGSLRQRVLGARVYLLPLAYAFVYIGTYCLRLDPAWRAHVMGGDLAINAQFYVLGLMGRQLSGLVSSVAAFAVLLVATGFAAAGARPSRSGGVRVFAYLAVIFATNMALVARARYPDNFYLFTAEWAFLGFLGTAFVLLLRAGLAVRTAGLGALSVLLVIFLHKRIGDMSGWGSGELLREARVLAADYARLRPFCGAGMAQGMSFIFPEPPLGLFYFFRGGSDGPEQLVAPFICNDKVTAPMSYSYNGRTTSEPGTLKVTFNQDLTIQAVSKK